MDGMPFQQRTRQQHTLQGKRFCVVRSCSKKCCVPAHAVPAPVHKTFGRGRTKTCARAEANVQIQKTKCLIRSIQKGHQPACPKERSSNNWVPMIEHAATVSLPMARTAT
eukprot:38001-Pelagomonas_calceolata.AAC.4